MTAEKLQSTTRQLYTAIQERNALQTTADKLHEQLVEAKVREQELINRVGEDNLITKRSMNDTSRRMADVEDEFGEIIDAAVREAEFWRKKYKD